MTIAKLTEAASCAHKGAMRRGWSKSSAGGVALMLAIGSAGLGGCIQVEAPDEPIVIELNINIEQQVVYRLARDAEEAIEDNPAIF